MLKINLSLLLVETRSWNVKFVVSLPYGCVKILSFIDLIPLCLCYLMQQKFIWRRNGAENGFSDGLAGLIHYKFYKILAVTCKTVKIN